jgi:hypothetical protein
VIHAVYQAIAKDLVSSASLREALSQRGPDEAAFFALVSVGAEIDNGGFADQVLEERLRIYAKAHAAG